MQVDEIHGTHPQSALSIPPRDVDDRETAEHHAIATSSGRTLLPAPVASLVSLATRSTSFALRFGTFIGGYGFGAAKFTTLSSLELGRGILEGLLSRAGKDVVDRTRSDLGKDNAETILERSLETLHQTVMQVVFWTATGFHVTETTVSSVSQISQLFLSVLDQFFGSTDSSRAIASIITLIRHEFQNPTTGVPGEKVGVVDLVIGLCGLAYLQKWCRRAVQEEVRMLGQEEVIWDVVVLNNGLRVDVHEDSLYGVHKGSYTHHGRLDAEDGLVQMLGQGHTHDSGSEDEFPEIRLRRQIMSSLPREASLSISTSTTTTKIVTVEVKGASNLPLLTPPGVDIIESEITNPGNYLTGVDDNTPTYRVVYRISRNTVTNSPHRNDRVKGDSPPKIEFLGDDDEDDVEDDASVQSGITQQRPPVPPKPPRSASFPAPSAPGVEGPNSPSGPVRSSSSYNQPGDKSHPIYSAARSSLPRPNTLMENAANQKKVRQPAAAAAAAAAASRRPMSSAAANRANPKLLAPATNKSGSSVMKPGDIRGGIRKVLKKGSVTGLSNLLNKDSSNEEISQKGRPSMRPPWGSNKSPGSKPLVHGGRSAIPERTSSMFPGREVPRPPQRGNPNFFSSRDLGGGLDGPSTRTDYVAAHQRRNSLISQTDTFSVHSVESRPGSPTLYRSSQVSRSMSGNDLLEVATHSPSKQHPRPKSYLGLYTPSIYTLKTSGSQTSLVLSSLHQKSAYSDSEAVDMLRKTGMVDGMFPNFHILRNITRYSRFASAAYGSHFLKLMGIAKETPVLKTLDETHRDVRSFAHHTELPADSILLSSFVDPQGGSDSTGSTGTGIPLVHTIAVDQESKAVVLACRGTLGFEDVLADMMCDYDDLYWRGKTYKVHKGIHASARRLLYGGDGRVLYTLREALEEFPEYGLVLCGHSLGGAVAALLGAMLAEPAVTGTAFVTSAEQHRRLLTNATVVTKDSNPISLPAGRPIHVYAYGPPSTMSPSLQKATRGLITTTVHGNDLVPFLSLGVLHDFQAVALAFKTDNSEAKAEVRRRIWEGLQSGLADKWYNNAPKFSADDEDKWAFAALKALRASMLSPKLLPPGEVFVVESTPVLRRDAFVSPGQDAIGRSATRVVLKYIRDVETRFREVKFGSSMLADHSPGRYEDALRRLTLGVV
ncbi:lipase [Xylariales sp. PMI_506]|nr:lipase [Xylariales sp. PMI_506]